MHAIIICAMKITLLLLCPTTGKRKNIQSWIEAGMGSHQGPVGNSIDDLFEMAFRDSPIQSNSNSNQSIEVAPPSPTTKRHVMMGAAQDHAHYSSLYGKHMNPLDRDKLPNIHIDKKQFCAVQQPLHIHPTGLKSRRNTIADKLINDGENTLQDLSLELNQMSFTQSGAVNHPRSSSSSNSNTTNRSSVEFSLPPINTGHSPKSSRDHVDNKWARKPSVKGGRRATGGSFSIAEKGEGFCGTIRKETV